MGESNVKFPRHELVPGNEMASFSDVGPDVSDRVARAGIKVGF